MPVTSGIEIIILPSGEPDPFEVLRGPPAIQIDDGQISVTISPLPQGKNDDPPIEIYE